MSALRTLILENTTGSVIFIKAKSIAASGGTRDFTDFPASAFRDDDDGVLTKITAGDLVVNDGVGDLSAADGVAYITNEVTSQTFEIVTEGSAGIVSIDGSAGTATVGSITVVGGELEVSNGDLQSGNAVIGIADNVVLPGSGALSVPTGTEGERPGAPLPGMLRFNDTSNLMEFYNGTEWINLSGTSVGPGTIKGNILGYHFLLDKDIYGSWLGTTTRHIASDEVQYVMPFNGEITALTYGCDLTGSDLDVFVEFAPFGSGAANTTLFFWNIDDSRVAHNSAVGEVFTIDWAGITGASLPFAAVPGAWFDVTSASSPYPGATYRFWFSGGGTTAPAVTTETLVAIPFGGGETAQAISDLVVTAMVTTSGEADFANADNAGGTTTLVSCTLTLPGNVTDTTDGTDATGAVFTVVADGGPFGLVVTKGGKLGVFAKDPGDGNVEPTQVVLSVFIQWVDEPQEEGVEDYAGVFTAP